MERFNTEQIKQLREIVTEVVQPLDARVSGLDTRMERGFAAVAEDIGDLRIELKGDIAKLDNRLTAIESKVGGIHNRIDEEATQRNNLETRVRSVLPNLPRRPEHI